MTLLERVQIRLQDEPKAENTPQLLELCDIASLSTRSNTAGNARTDCSGSRGQAVSTLEL